MGSSLSKQSTTGDEETNSKQSTSLGSSLIDNATHLCGSTKDTLDDSTEKKPLSITSLLQTADAMCISSPKNEDPPEQQQQVVNPSSALLARALVSEVTDNPNTMTPAAMAERERRLLKAQMAATKSSSSSKPVGTMGQPNLLGSLAHAIQGDSSAKAAASPTTSASVVPPNSLMENRAAAAAQVSSTPERHTKTAHTVTIGLCLSRRTSVGHADTVTRQTAFDFNELQDRQYKYVSSTDASGWMAGGGERGSSTTQSETTNVTSMLTPQGQHKLAAPDMVHIPIITINAESSAAVNAIVTALARGEIFIPHMAILPEALSVNGVSPPDLVVRFGCERNDDVPPEEWPNWCCEFMHNQLYEYFKDQGAQWSPRPFQITLARKVRWKTVKHMNRYFAHAERVIDAWREKGPQYLDPQLSYIEGGATPEEVARPHGIYLLRNGVPTNYFCPNFDPPYTTKMTRSLLLNVLSKSWDKKRREWTSVPVPRLVTPTMLMATMCGCTDPNQGGFMANEVTSTNIGTPKRVTAIPTNAQESRDAEEEEYTQLMDASMSGKSGADVSSVHLTPYDDEDGIPIPTKPDPVAQLETTLEDDLSLEDDDDDFFDTEDIDMLGDRLGDKETEKARGGGRYGSSPIPEMGDRFKSTSSPMPCLQSGSPTPESSRRSPTPEMARLSSNSPPVSPGNPNILSPTETPAPSEFGSTTTVQHMNSSSERLMQRELERKVSRELKKEGLTLQAEEIDEESSSFENMTPKSSSSTPRKKKKSKNKVKDAYEKERARQIAMIALAQQETIKETRKDGALSEKNGNAPKYSMDPAPSPKRAMERNDSGSVSLEYSIDSSMLGDSSTLAGQYIGGDASVGTAASRRRAKMSSEEDESATSQTTVVPSDEELFAVGWAKALDPKSGSYYYFTLDRSKIVWENPLAPEDGLTNASSSAPT